MEDAVAADETITIRDAYLAMYYFVTAYWERGGRRDGSVTLLRHAIGPSRDPDHPDIPETADPAFWDDWLAAVALARAQGFPDEL
jgi:hypothetical protein